MIKRICKTCNKVFSAFPSDVKYSGAKYCSKLCRDKGMIGTHRGKEIKKGQHLSPETEFKKGQKSINWKGGRNWINGYLYIWKPDHPRSQKSGYVKNTFLVTERKIGRPLRDNEVVHHIDENKKNDNPENLLVMTKTEHLRYHAQKRWSNGNFRDPLSEKTRKKMSQNARKYQTEETKKKISETMKRKGLSPQLYK